jgi:large subunit ribosomal protein L4
MAVVDVVNVKGETVSQMDLDESVFGVAVKPSVLHDVVTMQLAARRSGSASVKRRSDVRGSTRKLFRQKGTGRARRGDIKSPLLRGGGVIFGPSPGDKGHKLPKKVRRLAMKMALSDRFGEGRLTVVDQIELPAAKTREFVRALSSLGRENALVVIDGPDETLERSSRNVPYAKVLRSEGLNVYDILKYEHLILLASSVEKIQGRLST